MRLTSLRVVSNCQRFIAKGARRASNTSINSVKQASVHNAFVDIRSALSLLQGGRIRSAELQAEELTRELEDANIWIEDYNNASRKQRQLSQLQKQISSVDCLRSNFSSLSELYSLADSQDDNELYNELIPEILSLRARSNELVKMLLLAEPADAHGAYVEIKAGSGGTEACDWAGILSRMYCRWAQSHGYKVSVIDETLGDIAGIKQRTLLVDGPYAYGHAQFESGIHRLVRMSPFDSTGQRHTSFASVQVSPYFGEEDIDQKDNVKKKGVIDVNPTDLQITTMRSSGAGGQHVNKTESAVRILHVPTGIVVACQTERSQHRNKAVAISLLKSRLYDMEQLQKAQNKATSYNNLPEISWGSQIRSYTLQPYQLIKDLRTGYEISSNVQAVLDGDIDGFMESSLQLFRGNRTPT